MVEIAAGLKVADKYLTSLDVSANALNKDAVISLLQAVFKGSVALTSLNLAGNEIGDEGCKAIGEALKVGSVDVF